jgi:hypothetical protein
MPGAARICAYAIRPLSDLETLDAEIVSLNIHAPDTRS